MARGNNAKSDNKATQEKVKSVKVLSPKRQLEADHLAGKHKAVAKEEMHSQASTHQDCGYCQRRYVKSFRKEQATKRYFASTSKK